MTSEFNWRMTIMGEREDDVEAPPMGAVTNFTIPFEADAETLLALSLEQVGIFGPEGYDIERAEGGGYVIRDALDGEAMYVLSLEDDEADDDAYDGSDFVSQNGHRYAQYDGEDE